MNASTRPNILIVDDQQANIKALLAILQDIDANVITAQSGNEALALLLDHELALMLLDVDMPDMDGYEVADMARGLEQTQYIPIVFVTAAYRDEWHRLKGYQSGAIDYIERPIHDEVLRTKVNLFLELHRTKGEAKQLYQQLVSSNEHLHFILEGANDGVWDWDIQTGSVYFSPKWQTMLGYQPGDIEPHVRSWQKLVHPDDVGLVLEVLDAHLYGVTPMYETEHRLRTRGGDWIWVLDRGKVVQYTNDGKPLRMVGTHQDITERKRMEAELRRNEKKYRDLTERVPVGIYKLRWQQDGNRSFDYVSQPFCELLGLDHDAIMQDAGRAFTRVYAKEKDQFMQLNQYVRANQMPFLWEGRFWVGEQLRWLHIQSFPILQDNGDSVWDGVVIDITERKLFEQSLKKARKEAEDANQAKSRFLATMSHEIRTPLNTILGVGEVLAASTRLSDKEKNLLDVSNKAGMTLLTLINDILDLSKIEAGQLHLEDGVFDPALETRQTVAFVTEAATQKGLQLTCSLATDLPLQVRGDVHRWRQVLLNLLNNAIKFTEQGSIVVRVAAWADEKLYCSVTDSGIGIEKELCYTIFQPFIQAENSTTRRFGGTGLGLSICRQLVRKMGGKIWVESQKATGSVFHFTVHMPPVDASTIDQAVVTLPDDQPVAVQPDSSRNDQGLHILLVDDMEDNRLVVQAFLDTTSHQIVEACNGTEALQLLVTRSFDLVLMDIMMPVMDGLATTRQWRAIEASRGLRRTPVVAMTANSMKEDIQQTMAAGCDMHLTKPVRRADLLHVIMSYADLCSCQLPAACAQLDVEMVASSEEAINRVKLAELKADVGTGFQSVLSRFSDSFPQRLAALAQAWSDNDAGQVAMITHKLKGSSATFGATTFSDLCARLELCLHQEGLSPRGAEIMAQLMAEGERVQQQLLALLFDTCAERR
ncbi:MAG: response regulator [Magnetococcales bacterium]|nr:response regulator [Magnetococcales bacterium]